MSTKNYIVHKLFVVSDVKTMTLGELLKFHREKLGLTQEQVGDACKVSKTSVYYWEKSEKTPHPKKAGEISKILGIPVGTIMRYLAESNESSDEEKWHGYGERAQILLKMAGDILSAENTVLSMALEHNIVAFHQALMNGRKVDSLTLDMDTMKTRMAALEKDRAECCPAGPESSQEQTGT